MAIWRILRWAIYLACSWTWCIGMFLPVLMVRDYGIWAFVVFGVPNVVGAAAFGWVLARPGASEALVARHGRAMAIFSEVTLAFHACFLVYLMSMFGGFEAVVLIPAWAVGAILVDQLLKLLTGVSLEARAPLRTLIVSAGMFAIAAAVGSLDVTAFARGAWRGPDPGLLWLAPVCVVGFMLCPYLDLTFHRARQQCAGRAGTAAFVIGFGVVFVAMILMTLAYGSLINGSRIAHLESLAILTTAIPIGAHIVGQMVFTCSEHFGCMSEVTPNRYVAPPLRLRDPIRRRDVAWIIGASVTPLMLIAMYWLLRTDVTYKGMALGEVGYRCFMGFYALAFPAYVWLMMLPTRDGHSGPAGAIGKKKLRVLWMTIGFATPMFWMGFIEGSELWLGPGVLAILIARLALPRG